MREKDYVVIIGSANIDVAGYSHESLNYADSNPGKIKFTPGGVGRNIAQNLALLGNKAWLLSAVGSDFYGQSLLTQTNQSGVYVDKCLIVPGENTSSYLSLLDNTGEMLVAINDMNISNAITAEYPHSTVNLFRGQRSLSQTVISVKRHWHGFWIMPPTYPYLSIRFQRGNVSKCATV